MTKIRAALVFLTAFSVVLASAGAARADENNPAFSSKAADDYVDITATDESAKQHRRAQRARAAPRLVRVYVPACVGNTPDSASSAGALCARAVRGCAGTTNPDDLLYWVFTAPAGPPAPGPGDFVFANQAVCRGVGEVPEVAVPVFTAADFRRLPLPAGRVNVQPPNGRTLVNVPTNVFVGVETVTLPTSLLGFAVRVRATPERFVWRFGDGGRLSTGDPGAAYPEMRTTHTYTRAGVARVRLTTVYSGEYSVAGGAWLPIEGTAEVESAPAALTVVAARNELVAEPAGTG